MNISTISEHTAMRSYAIAFFCLFATPSFSNQYECQFSVDDVPQLTVPCLIESEVAGKETCSFTYSKDVEATCVGFVLIGSEILVCGWAVPGAFFDAERLANESSVESIRALTPTSDIYSVGTVIDAPDTETATLFGLSVDYNHFAGPTMLTAGCEAP